MNRLPGLPMHSKRRPLFDEKGAVIPQFFFGRLGMSSLFGPAAARLASWSGSRSHSVALVMVSLGQALGLELTGSIPAI